MMKKDLVILFYPKTEPDNIYLNLPIAMLKLASEVVANGYRVKIIDSRIEKNYDLAIKESLPQAVCFGVSSMTGYQIYHGIMASQVVKREFPNLAVIWGGWHPSLIPEETLKNDFIDIIVRGQGEKTLIEIINVLMDGSSLEGVKGIVYKNKNGEVIYNTERPFEDINNFVSIDFNLIDVKRYIDETPLGKRTIFWNTSQGCLYSCGFCCSPAMYGKHWSGLRAERILDEIEILVKRYKVDSIVFCDDNFFTDKDRIQKLCGGLLSRNLKLKWSTDGRIDQVINFSDAFLSLLKKSGCDKIFLGAESGNQDVLDLIDKKISVKDTFRAVELLNRNNIIAELFLMAGFFLNPEKELNDTIHMISEIKRRYPNHQATPTLYTPYPRTKLFDMAKAKGFSSPVNLKDWIDWNIVSPKTPWVNKRYLDKFNMLIKFYLPFAYPSNSLYGVMQLRWLGFFYKLMHRMAKFRVKKNFMFFPLEWHLIKYFYYKVKLKKKIFRKIAVPR